MVSPISKKNRIIELDVIRGFALFGVLLVNLTMIDATLYSDVASSLTESFSLSLWLIDTLAVGKFYSLFSMLFGAGFYYFVFKDNSPLDEATLLQNTSLFKRRLIILLFMGLIHMTLVWYGDILHVYAFTGFFLINKRDKTPKELIRTGLIWWLASTVIFAYFSILPSSMNDTLAKTALNAYQSSSYLEMLSYRLTHEVPLVLTNLLVVPIRIYGLFLLGYGYAKSGFFSQIEKHQILVKKLALSTSVIFIAVIIAENVLPSGLLQSLFRELSTLSGATFYACILILSCQNKWTRERIKPLASLGQMAVTNYLMQTICFTFFYYGYGFAKFHQLAPMMYWYLAIGFILIQIVVSHLWLRHHRFGPVEWVWRRLTYKQNPKVV